MLTGVVCYVERTPGGNAIRRLRLVGPELDQTWVAPLGPGDDPSRPPAPGEQIAHIRSAAAWIAEEIAPVRELVAICLDPEGGVCSWVSAPSTDPKVVMASIRQGAAPVGTGAELGASAGRTGGFGLLPDDDLGAGSGRSVQALAEPDTTSRTSLLPSRTKEVVSGPRQRLGVLSVADAPVRVLLDELDRLKIGVGAVLTLWHAAALAWDPSSAPHTSSSKRGAGQNGTADALEPIVVETEGPVAAAVIVDPQGRLVWAWSKGGDLLAAGTMRLRTHSYTRVPQHHAAPPEAPAASDSAIIDLGSAASRIAPEDTGEPIRATECASDDIGRLVMDWLAWSVQVGQTPERVVCVGPATIPHRPGPDQPSPTPESLARTLVGAWPGATVDAAVHDDPIGATLNRLRALPMFAPSRTPSGEVALLDDPRRNVVTLTKRPGRFDRIMHYWATVAILCAAAAVFLYTRRLGAGIEELRSRRDGLVAERLRLLESMEPLVPSVSKTADPVGLLGAKIHELNDQLTRVTPTTSVLERLLPAMEILNREEFASVQIGNITASDLDIRIDFSVPQADELLLPAIRDALDQKYGPNVWDGTRSPARNERIPYSIFWHLPGARN